MSSTLKNGKVLFEKTLEFNTKVNFLEDCSISLPKGYQIESFSVVNLQDKVERSNAKRFKNFQEAFKNAFYKLKSKPTNYKYKIVLNYLTETNSWNYGTLCFLIKEPEKTYFSLDYRNKLEIPINWLPKRRLKETKQEEKLHFLNEKYNIKEVVFRNTINSNKKEKFLLKIIGCFQILEKLKIDFFAFKPLTIATSKMSKWGGTYNQFDYLMNLIIGREINIFHEYFHHLDLSTMQLRVFEFDKDNKSVLEKTKAGEKYSQLFESLWNDKTMQNFYGWNKWMLNEHNAIKPTHLNSKRGKQYIYWTSPCEVIARFFEDFMFYNYKQEIEEKLELEDLKPRSFTIEEIEKHQDLLLEFLNEINNLQKTKN